MKKLLILTISICFVACSSEPPAMECPSWSAPQPIDSLLLGTWELVESSDNHSDLSINEIAFYENNYFFANFWQRRIEYTASGASLVGGP